MKTVRIYTHWFYTSGCWNGSRIYSNETNAGAALHSNVGGFMWVHTMYAYACFCVGRETRGSGWIDYMYTYSTL